MIVRWIVALWRFVMRRPQTTPAPPTAMRWRMGDARQTSPEPAEKPFGDSRSS